MDEDRLEGISIELAMDLDTGLNIYNADPWRQVKLLDRSIKQEEENPNDLMKIDAHTGEGVVEERNPEMEQEGSEKEIEVSATYRLCNNR